MTDERRCWTLHREGDPGIVVEIRDGRIHVALDVAPDLSIESAAWLAGTLHAAMDVLHGRRRGNIERTRAALARASDRKERE